MVQPRPHAKRAPQAVLAKQSKQELKDDGRSEKPGARSAGQVSSTAAAREGAVQASEGRQGGSAAVSTAINGGAALPSAKGSHAPPRPTSDAHGGLPKPAESKASVAGEAHDVDGAEKPRHLPSRPGDKEQRRSVAGDEQERLGKRRKAEAEPRDAESAEVRTADREKPAESFSNEEQPPSRLADRGHEKSKDKDHRDKADRADKLRGEDALEKSRERSMERYASDRPSERILERGADRAADKARDDRGKEERSKARHADAPLDKSHSDDRFQSLPPPPPLPPSFVPHSFAGSRRDEEVDRRATGARHAPRLSPKHDDKERRRSEENLPASHDEAKRRRDEDLRDRKRDERDLLQAKVRCSLDHCRTSCLGFSARDDFFFFASKIFLFYRISHLLNLHF